MKKIIIPSVISGLAVLGLASVSFSQKKITPVSIQPHWEYCRVVTRDINDNGVYGVSVFSPNQRKFTPFSKSKFEQQTVVGVIDQLGAQGWEIMSEQDYGYTLKRKK